MNLTYRKQRGYHYWLCIVCGCKGKERIPDQADDRYHLNPASPWEGICGRCARAGIASATIRVGNSSVPPQASPPLEYQTADIDGLWGEFWQVAKRYERKAPVQDREDVRHNIIIRLVEVAWAREANGEPFGELARLRTASYVVMEYWHTIKQSSTLVCIFSGIATKPKNESCTFKGKPKKCSQCPYLAIRPALSLNTLIASEDDTTELWETIADDKAIDLDAWVDARTWLLGCPLRLIQIAQKRVSGIALDPKDQEYLRRFRRQRQLSLKWDNCPTFDKPNENKRPDKKALQNDQESP